MTDTGLQQQVAAAARYDEFFVPALFEEWAGRVAEAAVQRRAIAFWMLRAGRASWRVRSRIGSGHPARSSGWI